MDSLLVATYVARKVSAGQWALVSPHWHLKIQIFSNIQNIWTPYIQVWFRKPGCEGLADSQSDLQGMALSGGFLWNYWIVRSLSRQGCHCVQPTSCPLPNQPIQYSKLSKSSTTVPSPNMSIHQQEPIEMHQTCATLWISNEVRKHPTQTKNTHNYLT